MEQWEAFRQSLQLKNTDKRRFEEAVELLNTACLEKNAGKDSVQPEVIERDGEGEFLEKLLNLSAYEARNGAAPQDVFQDYLRLYKDTLSHTAKNSAEDDTAEDKAAISTDDGKAIMARVESDLFTAVFEGTHYFLWAALQNTEPADSAVVPQDKRAAPNQAYKCKDAPTGFAKGLLQGLLSCLDIMDNGLEKFFRQKRQAIPSLQFLNVLRIGLYEYLIGLASGKTIKYSLNHLIKKIASEDGALTDREKAQTEKFIKNQLEKCARSVGRSLAFQIIYSLAFTDIDSLATLRHAFRMSPYNVASSLPEREDELYSWQLLYGVWKNVETLDAIINKYSHKWRVERMGKIEITLLRLGLFELLYNHVPARIVISEIMDIADMYGASEAKNLVNGILDAVSKADEFNAIH